MAYQQELPKTRVEFWILRTISILSHVLLGFCIGTSVVLYFWIMRNDFDRGMKAMEMIMKKNPEFCMQIKGK